MRESEISLEERKASAAMEFEKTIQEFGLEKSPIFVAATEKMKGMKHGPNHSEGDPLEHSQLYVAELNSYIAARTEDFLLEEAHILRISGALHDIGKAETQKFDVVSDRQNEVVGASPEQIEEAQNVKFAVLSEISGKTVDEIKALSGGKQRDLISEHEIALQQKLAGVAQDFPALTANFRGHDKKSAEMGKNIVEEAGVSLSTGDAELFEYLVVNHMKLLDLSSLSEADMNDPKKTQGHIKNFENLFVEGTPRKINEQKIKMLLALTYGDNASTYTKGQSDEDRKRSFGAILMSIDGLRVKMQFVLEKESTDKKISDVLQEAFKDQGGLVGYFTKEKGLAGKQIGDAVAPVKEFVRDNLKKDFVELCGEVRRFAKEL